MTTSGSTGSVIGRIEGGLGRLILNEPSTLNSLTVPIIDTLTEMLGKWRDDPAVHTVLLEGSGRAFCAGGNVRVTYRSAVEHTQEASDVWRRQYLLNAALVTYPKPVVSLLDGITMGGGVGLGCHVTHRIVTENSVLAMPEVSIGFSPDAGGLLLYARAPGEVGTHLALTAGRIGPADALWCGLADHFVKVERTDDLRRLLRDLPASEAIGRVETTPPRGSELAGQRDWIDDCYGGDDVLQIVQRLRDHSSPDARSAAERIMAMSPLAVQVCLRALRSAARLNNPLDVFVQDYRVMVHAFHTHDLVAGIDSAIISKNRAPVWDPATLCEVTEDMIDSHFAPLTGGDLPVHQYGSRTSTTRGPQTSDGATGPSRQLR